MTICYRMRFTIVVLLSTALLVGVSPAAEFERPPTLPAQVLAPASLLSGNVSREQPGTNRRPASALHHPK